MIKKYVKKPIEVEAVQWTGDNAREIEEFTNWRACQNIYGDGYGKSMVIETLQGETEAIAGCYIIKDANGECYPCKADIFKETYEEIK